MSENVNVEELTDNLKSYVNTNLELLKLELAERFSVIVAGIAGNILVAVCVSLFVLFISISAGFYLSGLLGSYCAGFAVIAAFYLLLTLILVFGRRKLVERPVCDRIIRSVFSKNGNVTPDK